MATDVVESPTLTAGQAAAPQLVGGSQRPTPQQASPAMRTAPVHGNATSAVNNQATNVKTAHVAAGPTVADDDEFDGGLVEQFKYWFTTQAPSWAASAVVHMVLFLIAVLVLGAMSNEVHKSDAPKFDAALADNMIEPQLERFELGEPQLDPSELNTESLMETTYDPVPQEAEYNDDSAVFEKRGGGTVSTTDSVYGGLGLNVSVLGGGTAMKGGGGMDGGGGFGTKVGKGGDGMGFGGRGAGKRDAIAGGGTKNTERAVAAALNWLARHQNPDGSWSIQHNTAKCKDPSCKFTGGSKADVGATAMALLPFLAAGQTHMTKGPHQRTVLGGINWLIAKQKASGDLSTANGHQMYEHGLAAICLCECYGMSGDPKVGYAAQAALNFISSGQNGKGGWRYQHGTQDTDTSVVGWQVMALKSGQMSGLQVNPAILDKAKSGLMMAASGEYKGKFSYSPNNKTANAPMTAVGLLCMQYLGTPRGDPGMIEGIEYLMKMMPAATVKDHNIYYWYYATQVLHNTPGPEWEKWNRNMRTILVNSQVRGNVCAEGSWDPAKDSWGNRAGGRIMTTALSCLTLEVYYRYLPLYKLDRDEDLEKPKMDKMDKAAVTGGMVDGLAANKTGSVQVVKLNN